MWDKKSVFYFCAAEEESLAVVRSLQERQEKAGWDVAQERHLSYMQKRLEESQIWLMPAVIYAAANHGACRDFFLRAQKEELERWQEAGTAWLRRYPSLLNRVGWQERRFAVWAAGLCSLADKGERLAQGALRRMLADGWTFLWSRVKQGETLRAKAWEELLKPWADSDSMGSAMAGILLLTANLQKKPVLDRDQLWRDLRRLNRFCKWCIQPPEKSRGVGAADSGDDVSIGARKLARAGAAAVREDSLAWGAGVAEGAAVSAAARACGQIQQKRMAWLLAHFKNPQRPAYLKEKGRISSEWLDILFGVMERAGLPKSACETMKISCGEVYELLDFLEDKLSERQYMTFLLLYAVSRELARAGQAAAANQMPPAAVGQPSGPAIVGRPIPATGGEQQGGRSANAQNQ